MNQRMKQRIQRLEGQQATTESPIDCVILVPMQEGGKKERQIATLSGYGITVHRLVGETDAVFKERAKNEIRMSQPTGLLLLSSEF